MGIERHRRTGRRAQFCSLNTRLSGTARVDSTNVLPSGRVRGQTSCVKITEDVRKYAAEQGIADEEALAKGLADKSEEFADKGAVVYARA